MRCVLAEWYEIDIFHVHQRTDVFGVRAQRVVRRYGDNKRVIVSQTGLGGIHPAATFRR